MVREQLRKAIFFVTTAAVVILPACGSSEPTVSKAVFLDTAERICQKTANAQERDYSDYVGVGRWPPGVKKRILVRISVAKIPKEIEELEALPLPAGREDEAEAIIQGIKAAAGEVAPNAAPAELRARFAPVNAEAERFGFTTCSAAP